MYQRRDARGCFVVEVLDDDVEERVAECLDRRCAVHRGFRLPRANPFVSVTLLYIIRTQ